MGMTVIDRLNKDTKKAGLPGRDYVRTPIIRTSST